MIKHLETNKIFFYSRCDKLLAANPFYTEEDFQYVLEMFELEQEIHAELGKAYFAKYKA